MGRFAPTWTCFGYLRRLTYPVEMKPKSIHSPEYRALLEWLRKCRKKRDLTMRDVGPLLGLPHSWVQKTESGERRLDVAEYVRLCHVLGADPGEGLGVVEANLGPYTPAADASLKAVFGGKACVNMFEMTKLVSKHLS